MPKRLKGETRETFGFAGVAGITMICYLAGLALRLSPLDNKWIPLGCGVLGGALGLAGLALMADFPAANLIDALAVGIASGLAATGMDQLGKQLGE